ncbi:hypothetical protein OPV22_024436 [Ensete ventricosum]|uniref:mitogen-activated protein kinase kinase kinase n=1 Tax=Ensete ventricosum TaxID=4639 RepID=A0AAV8QGZ4_ENSVE|nr:hypothetical protein OPV22_024436 [Ensete ventricosum]
MPWWKSRSTNHLLSSSSASPSSGVRRSPRDVRFFPWSRREPQPRLTRQRKLRHLTNLQIEALSLEDPLATTSSSTPVSRSHSNLDATPSRSVSSPMLLPCPLPLPEAAPASPHRESVSGRGLGFSPPNSVGFPLPSPSGASNKAEDDQGNGAAAETTSPVSAVGSRLAYQTNCRSSEQDDISLDKSTISHRRKGFSCGQHQEALPRMFPENSAAWHGNGGNVIVHPLPLPPGATPSSQSAFGHQNAAKAEASVKANQWKKGKLIGSGTFGNVYEATNRHNGALCAMKEVNIIPDDAKSAECLKQLEQEIRFLSQFKHPNIVQYYGSETIANRLYIYLEYVHPGSINKYVRQYCGAISESVVRNFTRHILNGLIYLHSKQIMHRDIKGANLLVDVNGVVKLADFGMAKHLSGAAPANSLKGSPFWMAPEMLQATMNKETGYDLSVDIWSLGCTIIEMFTGKHPWNGLEGPQAMFKVLNKDPPIPETLSNVGKDFVQRCFCRNPAERPTAGMLLEHPFVRNCHCHNLQGSLQTSAGIKSDSALSSRDKGKFKNEPSVKRKHTSNQYGNSQSHPEVSESAASSHHSSRLTLEVSASLSPRSSLVCSSGNTQDVVVQLGGGDYFSFHEFPTTYGKKEVNFF